MNTIKGLFGIRTNAQQKAAEQTEKAQNAQQRAANASLEDAAQVRADQNASGRRLRGLGRRALAFMGSELGVTDSLAPTGA